MMNLKKYRIFTDPTGWIEDGLVSIKKSRIFTDPTGWTEDRLDNLFGQKKQRFIRGLIFVGIGVVILFSLMSLSALAEGSHKPLMVVANEQICNKIFWMKLCIGILLGSSPWILHIFKMIPWIEKNPGFFTFTAVIILFVLNFVAFYFDWSYLLTISNTTMFVLIMAYFAKPAYDNWREVKIVSDYSGGLAAESGVVVPQKKDPMKYTSTPSRSKSTLKPEPPKEVPPEHRDKTAL
jgi:hypothetical protein